jgi:subtilisin-like proprotein convertase family protein
LEDRRLLAAESEPNNTLATADVLGSEPFVTVQDATITALGDQDFYRYTAHDTGKLVVRSLFNHAAGNLQMSVLDSTGDVIATANSSSGVMNFEEIIIPVVGQQVYYVLVQDVGGAANLYNLEVEDFAAPVPTGVHLDPASDTGTSNSDNVTSDITPTFFIQTDVLEYVDANGNGMADASEIRVLTAAEATAGVTPGIAVEVTLVNTTTGTSTTGFASPLIPLLPEIYTYSSTALTPGVYLVSTRTKVFDGRQDPAGTPAPAMGRSTASPPLWMTIEVNGPVGGSMDLLPSSDTGMFDDDNVTAKWEPAFSGTGPVNNKVRVFAQEIDGNPNSPTYGMPIGVPLFVGSGNVGSDNTNGTAGDGLGLWEVTVEPMDEGKYNFFVTFEDAGGSISGPVAIGSVLPMNPNAAIPDVGEISVPFDLPESLGPIIDLNITINIEHGDVGDLEVLLRSPGGTTIFLSDNRGGTGANFTNTVFDDSAGTSIVSIVAAGAPFTGRFRPEQPLSTFNGNEEAGNWSLIVRDTSDDEQTGTLLSFQVNVQYPLMVVIDKTAPNTPYLDLLETSDSGRNDRDNITKDNRPAVTMTTTDPNVALAQLLFEDNLKFRIYDRFEFTSEFLLFDSALSPGFDASNVPGDMFTILELLSETLPDQYFSLFGTNNAVLNDGGIGVLADGVHNLKLEVEDRAGNISEDFLLSITIDTQDPNVNFGLPDGTSETDGLTASSDTGVTTMPATYADRITSDSTPTLWGRAEANSIVRVYLDRDYDGTIDLNTDTFLGQTVALPYDGNDAYPNGYWELTTALDLNQLLGIPKDGLRRLLVTAEDVAGNPMPMFDDQERPIIEPGDELQIFIDTQGPQVTDVTIGDYPDYDLFDPKPSVNGYTPLINRLNIEFRDLPSRVDQLNPLNDFLYEALQAGIAGTFGNYLLVGDHVGVVPIQSIIVNNEAAADYTFNGTLTTVTSTSVIRNSNFVGAAEQPVVGDYILINGGAATGQVRRIVAYNAATGEMTLDVPLLNLPAIGDAFTITTFAEATVTLTFATPLPDDRYTFTVRDNLVDPAGNRLDGESNVIEPHDLPFFASGDGVPGGSFIARFTVDSRPEIGSYVSQNINIDINGNGVWDPASGQGGDATHVDISWTLPVQNAGGTIGLGGFNVHDLLFAGKFRPINGNENNPDGPAVAAIFGPRYFDQLAAFGNSAEMGGVFRWIIDTNSDGVVTLGTDIRTVQPLLGNFNVAGAIPVAGNFDGNFANGDEIGLYNSGKWGLDFNRNFVIEANEVISTGLFGRPIVGDFDGDSLEDLAVFNNNVFYFNLANDGYGDANDRSFVWGYPGVLDQPVAADIDQDGIDDIGLWVPRTSATPPSALSQWYFLVSNDPTGALRVPGNVNRLNHAFTPVPFGSDLYAEFGDDRAMPIVGNFDPPVVPSRATSASLLAGDFDRNGRVDYSDHVVWKSTFGSTTNLAADGNGNGIVDSGDYSIWRDNLGSVSAAGQASASAGVTSSSTTLVAAGTESAQTVAAVEAEGAESATTYQVYGPIAPASVPYSSASVSTAIDESTTYDSILPTSKWIAPSLLLAPASSIGSTGGGSAFDFAISEHSSTLTDVESGRSQDADEFAFEIAWQSWDSL